MCGADRKRLKPRSSLKLDVSAKDMGNHGTPMSIIAFRAGGPIYNLTPPTVGAKEPAPSAKPPRAGGRRMCSHRAGVSVPCFGLNKENVHGARRWTCHLKMNSGRIIIKTVHGIIQMDTVTVRFHIIDTLMTQGMLHVSNIHARYSSGLLRYTNIVQRFI